MGVLVAGCTTMVAAQIGPGERVVGIGGKDETAQGLSDVERALLLARESGVDVILQLGVLDGTSDHFERLMCGGTLNEVRDCDGDEYRRAAWRVLLRGPVFRFTVRLIDVQSGEVLAAISASQAAVNNANTILTGYAPLDRVVSSGVPHLVLDCLRPEPGSHAACEAMKRATVDELVSQSSPTFDSECNPPPGARCQLRVSHREKETA